jgi:hypothetical protein
VRTNLQHWFQLSYAHLPSFGIFSAKQIPMSVLIDFILRKLTPAIGTLQTLAISKAKQIM